MVTGDIWQAFEASQLAKHGSWPNAGGWLDQPRILLDAIDCVRSNEAIFKSRAVLTPSEDDDE